MERIQMFAFVQSLVTKVLFPDMELTRMAPSFRANFKRQTGMSKNASTVAVLKMAAFQCNNNDMLDLYLNAIKPYPKVIEALKNSPTVAYIN